MTDLGTTILSLLDEGRLIRRAWSGTDAKGRNTACLLAALAPVCIENGDPSSCPSEIMPSWLAHLTVWIDDKGTNEAWFPMVRRYAAVASRWQILTPEDWKRSEWLVKIACIEEALTHVTVDEWRVRSACNQVVSVLRKAVETGSVDEEARSAAWSAARSAARSAASSAAWSAASSAARSAIWSAAESATWSATWSARSAATASAAASSAATAAWNAAESATWSAARSAAWSAAWNAAVDRLTEKILGIIEDACTDRENGERR